MGSMTNEEYITKFLELVRYVLHLKDEKEKIQRFISGLPLSFKDQIKLDESMSLEEAIRKLKNSYRQSKRKHEFKCDWKGNEKTK